MNGFVMVERFIHQVLRDKMDVLSGAGVMMSRDPKRQAPAPPSKHTMQAHKAKTPCRKERAGTANEQKTHLKIRRLSGSFNRQLCCWEQKGATCDTSVRKSSQGRVQLSV
jgi:hypothetical protein